MQDKRPVRVKICGITNPDDALMAAAAGADALGFVFYPKSPRYVSPEEAGEIIAKLPPFITTVGVFVDEALDKVKEIAASAGLNAVQLHGQESPTYCENMGLNVIKALRMRGEEDILAMEPYKVPAFLLDTYKEGQAGGTGEVFDWGLAEKAVEGSHKTIILSGGLTPLNIASAVKRVMPYAVDVSSGVESAPGIKDRDKVLAFIKRAKSPYFLLEKRK